MAAVSNPCRGHTPCPQLASNRCTVQRPLLPRKAPIGSLPAGPIGRIAARNGLAILLAALPADAHDISSVLDSMPVVYSALGAIVGAGLTVVASGTRGTSSDASEGPSQAEIASKYKEALENEMQKTERLIGEVQNAESSRQRADAVAAESQSELTSLKARLGELEAALSRSESLENELQAAKDRADAMQVEIEKARGDAVAAARAEFEKERLSTVASETESLRAELDTLRQEIQSKDEELIRGRMERESLRMKIISAERIATQVQNDSSKRVQEAEVVTKALETQVLNLEKQVEASYADQNALLSRLEAMQEAKNTSEAQISAAVEDATAAKSLVLAERERNATVEAARAAAVEDAKTLLAERRELILALEDAQERAQKAEKEAHEERLSRVATEKALESTNSQMEHLVAELSAAQAETQTALAEADEARKRAHQAEEEEKLAAHDSKEALHREMEVVAELERVTEAMEALRIELGQAKRAAEQTQNGMKEEEVSASAPAGGAKRRGRPRKVTIDNDGGSMSEEEMNERVNAADAAAAKAELMAKEAQQRAIEIRAEAALLVETVEDRAVEAVEAAQAEVERLKAELKRVVGNSGE